MAKHITVKTAVTVDSSFSEMAIESSKKSNLIEQVLCNGSIHLLSERRFFFAVIYFGKEDFLLKIHIQSFCSFKLMVDNTLQ